MSKLTNLFLSIMIAGVIVLFIGLYFCVIGAGIPYQDSTAEMLIKWNANYMAGTFCLKVGAGVASFGVFGNVIIKIMKRTNYIKKI